jgi:hypothetical protein
VGEQRVMLNGTDRLKVGSHPIRDKEV